MGWDRASKNGNRDAGAVVKVEGKMVRSDSASSRPVPRSRVDSTHVHKLHARELGDLGGAWGEFHKSPAREGK